MKLACLLLMAALIGGAANEAFAQTAPATGEEARAVELYARGRDLLATGKPEEALPALRESRRVLASPNTDLLIAHALRDLHRRADAIEQYETAIDSAHAAVELGGQRYAETEGEARRWVVKLRPQLALVHIRAPRDARLEIRRSADLDNMTRSGPTRLWAEPGQVTISGTLGSRRQSKSAAVVAGDDITIELGALDGSATADRSQPTGGSVVSVPGIVLLGVGVVGMGLFTGFGLSAKSANDELEANGCYGPGARCDDELRQTRDTGTVHQVVADVSLGVGIAGVAGGAAWWLIEALTSKPSAHRSATFRVGLPAGTSGAGILIDGRY